MTFWQFHRQFTLPKSFTERTKGWKNKKQGGGKSGNHATLTVTGAGEGECEIAGLLPFLFHLLLPFLFFCSAAFFRSIFVKDVFHTFSCCSPSLLFLLLFFLLALFLSVLVIVSMLRSLLLISFIIDCTLTLSPVVCSAWVSFLWCLLLLTKTNLLNQINMRNAETQEWSFLFAVVADQSLIAQKNAKLATGANTNSDVGFLFAFCQHHLPFPFLSGQDTDRIRKWKQWLTCLIHYPQLKERILAFCAVRSCFSEPRRCLVQANFMLPAEI